MDLSRISIDAAQRAAALFRVLGDKTRLRIVLMLARGGLTVSDLTAGLRLRQPNVSQHLAVMRDAAVLEPRRQGKHVFYWLTNAVRVGGGDGGGGTDMRVTFDGITMQFVLPRGPAGRPPPR